MKTAIEKYDELDTDEQRRAYFLACVELMDDEAREKLHIKLAPCDDRDYLDAYCSTHLGLFGTAFFVD